MILIEGEKYACVQCIRGHRSSTCKHTLRPLVQVRSRGRPMQSVNYRIAVLTEDIHSDDPIVPGSIEGLPSNLPFDLPLDLPFDLPSGLPVDLMVGAKTSAAREKGCAEAGHGDKTPPTASAGGCCHWSLKGSLGSGPGCGQPPQGAAVRMGMGERSQGVLVPATGSATPIFGASAPTSGCCGGKTRGLPPRETLEITKKTFKCTTKEALESSAKKTLNPHAQDRSKSPVKNRSSSPAKETPKRACGKSNVIVLRASKRRIVQNDLSAVTLTSVASSVSGPQKKMQGSFRASFGLPDKIATPQHGTMCACCNTSSKVNVFKLELPANTSGSAGGGAARGVDFMAEPLTNAAPFVPGEGYLTSFFLSSHSQATPTQTVDSLTQGDLVFAPACSIPGSCACDETCECEGCVSHDNGIKMGAFLGLQPTEGLLFDPVSSTYPMEASGTVQGEEDPHIQGSLDPKAALNAFSIAEYEWVLDDCECAAEECWCYNCDMHGIVNGVRLGEGKQLLGGEIGYGAGLEVGCGGLPKASTTSNTLDDLHLLDLECQCLDDSCCCVNCFKHGIINGIRGLPETLDEFEGGC